jgi:Cu/Ag efflux protein CusF
VCTQKIAVLAILLSIPSMAALAVQARTVTVAWQSQDAHDRTDVVGEVLKVDTEAHSITLRKGLITITLHISHPVLQGYGSVAAIKKGDRVGVGYTPEGIHITKMARIADEGGPPKDLAEKSLSAPSPPRKARKPSPFARRARGNGKSFAEVDNNKDGKISPVELSVVIPNLTVEQFRQHDKNHDGHLDRAEFEQIKIP